MGDVVKLSSKRLSPASQLVDAAQDAVENALDFVARSGPPNAAAALQRASNELDEARGMLLVEKMSRSEQPGRGSQAGKDS